jgi:hypothetical protein
VFFLFFWKRRHARQISNEYEIAFIGSVQTRQVFWLTFFFLLYYSFGRGRFQHTHTHTHKRGGRDFQWVFGWWWCVLCNWMMMSLGGLSRQSRSSFWIKKAFTHSLTHLMYTHTHTLTHLQRTTKLLFFSFVRSAGQFENQTQSLEIGPPRSHTH